MLIMFTDSKQLFDFITQASHTTEKRLMIDVAAAREAYYRHEISNVGLIAGEDNIPDCLTKPTSARHSMKFFDQSSTILLSCNSLTAMTNVPHTRHFKRWECEIVCVLGQLFPARHA